MSAGVRSGCYLHEHIETECYEEGVGTYSLMNPMQPIQPMEMVRHQDLILQRMLGADRNKGLGRLQRLKALGLPRLLPPCVLLPHHME